MRSPLDGVDGAGLKRAAQRRGAASRRWNLQGGGRRRRLHSLVRHWFVAGLNRDGQKQDARGECPCVIFCWLRPPPIYLVRRKGPFRLFPRPHAITVSEKK